jgi:metal-responsive CopG/Arc/MetJ family transcriptional regulator
MAVRKVKITITVTEDLVKRLENYRRSKPKIPSRSEAVTELLDEMLKAKGFQERKENA